MSYLSETFKTTNKSDYKWPSSLKIVSRPTPPPIDEPKVYMDRPVEENCHCDMHSYYPYMQQYKELGDKEKRLVEELDETKKKLTSLSNKILNHACDDDDIKMKSLYQIDYARRGEPIVEYRPIRAEIDAPEGSPIKFKGINLAEGFRDPHRFRYQATVRPRIGADRPVTFITTPKSIEAYFTQTTPRSEYQGTIAKSGHANLRSMQQYKQPLPSSRRRLDDVCL